MILDLKDIVELVVAPVHREETTAYLEARIYDHREHYLELFPHIELHPKYLDLVYNLLFWTFKCTLDDEI